MELLEIMLNRRSVRDYTGEPVPGDKLQQILQAGLLSPSGRARRPWEFIVVQDREALETLSHCRKAGSRMLEQAGCAIVVFADAAKTDVWTEDCAIAMSNMHLMADSLGLGSCWIQGRLREAEDGRTTEEFCREMFSVPEGYELEAILSIGVLKQHPDRHSLDELSMDQIHFGKFGCRGTE